MIYRITWEDLGHKLRAGCVSLNEFRAYFSQGPAFLRDVHVTTVRVIDHLGQNTPIPIIFCSRWKARFLVNSRPCCFTDLCKLGI